MQRGEKSPNLVIVAGDGGEEREGNDDDGDDDNGDVEGDDEQRKTRLA